MEIWALMEVETASHITIWHQIGGDGTFSSSSSFSFHPVPPRTDEVGSWGDWMEGEGRAGEGRILLWTCRRS